MLRTRSGSEIRFNDEAGHETIDIRTAAGQSVRLTSEGGGSTRIADGKNSTVTLTPAGITLQTSSTVEVNASTITLEAAAVNLRSALVTCDGMLKSAGERIYAEELESVLSRAGSFGPYLVQDPNRPKSSQGLVGDPNWGASTRCIWATTSSARPSASATSGSERWWPAASSPRRPTTPTRACGR